MKGSQSQWRFLVPKNCAVITSKDILECGMDICNVCHHLDGNWQFHSRHGAPDSIDESRVVALVEIVDIDPTLEQLAALPLGWYAYRENKSSEWIWTPYDEEDEEEL